MPPMLITSSSGCGLNTRIVFGPVSGTGAGVVTIDEASGNDGLVVESGRTLPAG